MNSQENMVIDDLDNDDQVDVKQVLYKALENWYWIGLSVLLCFGLAFLYVRYSTPIYKITARVLVNDDKKGGNLGTVEALGSLGGLLGTKSTVDNEVEVFKTKYLMQQVIRDMNLDVTYYKEGFLTKSELYKSPFFVEKISVPAYFKPVTVKINFLPNHLLKIKTDDLDTVLAYNKSLSLVNVGTIRIKRNYAVPLEYDQYSFSLVPVKIKAASLMNNMNIGVNNKLITIIDLTLNYPLPNKGEDILNRMIYNYVLGNLKDKNEVADSTIKFIKERLAGIGNELQGLEGNIQVFKQKNNMADITEQGKLLVNTTGQYVADLAKIETQISILNSLEEYLKDDKIQRVLPSTLMPENSIFSALVERYNTLLLERDRRLLNSTLRNPVILSLNQQVANLRKDMLANLISTRNALYITKSKITSQMNAAEGQIKQVPATERDYLNLTRQQQIKQELYIFLMQRSEETAISKTSNIANSRTIDPPEADVSPVSPKKQSLYLGGVIIGLFIPFGILYLLELLNTKIQSKDDVIRKTNAPVIGEIMHNADKDNRVLINSRSVISEQFRGLRTNLLFYLTSTSGKVIMVTSGNEGEGKSFISLNLANILTLSGKRVVILELDLRKPGLSHRLDFRGEIGFTNFVIDSSISLDQIIHPLPGCPNLFFINSGPVPPNPAEMLMTDRLPQLIELLRTRFDYIIIDAPPIGLVTDPELIGPYTDMCLFVVRHRYSYKKQLLLVNALNQKKELKNIGIVINDIDAHSGYESGYGFGHGNSYGSYEEQNIKKGFFKRFSIR